MKIRSLLLLFIAGLLYAIGFPTYLGFEFFLAPTMGTLIALHLLSDEKLSFKHKFIGLFVFFSGLNLLGYSWLPYTFREFGNLPFPLDYLLWALFGFIILPQFYFFFFFQALFKKFAPYRIQSPDFRPYICISLWMLSEYFAPQQFSTHLGHPWLQLKPYLIGATISGVFLYSLLSSILLFLALHKLQNKNLHFLDLLKKYIPLVSLFTLTLIMHLAFPLSLEKTKNQSLNIRLVQANIGNFLKIDSETGSIIAITKVFDKYKNLSIAPSSKPLDLIIWPETAYPSYQYSKHLFNHPSQTPFVFSSVIDQTGAELFTGGYDYKDPDNLSYFENIWNAGFLFSQEKKLKQVHHKHILIPFGETLPFGSLTKPISKFVRNISYFARGSEFTLFKTRKGPTFINPICYEVLVESFIRKYLNTSKTKPDFILNLTNDSWYGKSNEPYQHKFLAHWRAIEHQLPMVRATNTGLTSILYSDGSESKTIPWYTENYLDLELQFINKPPTIFQKFGHFPLITLWLFCLLFVFFRRSK